MKSIEKIKDLLRVKSHIQSLKTDIEYQLRANYLVDRMLHDSESGVCSVRYAKEEVIVSLTTYGKRLYNVALAIESIMQGSMKPNRIVLWLGYELKDTPLPVAVQRQQQRGLQVEFCKDIRSHTKLIPSLKAYPDAAIITVDDDCLYDYDVVERLVNMHNAYPADILSNWVMTVAQDKKGRPELQYKWQRYGKDIGASFLNRLMGVSGVLYPPHSLDPEVMNEEVFMDICKFADDIWFYAMALKAGTKIRKSPTHDARGMDYLDVVDMQETPLAQTNCLQQGKMNGSDIQRIAVFDKYNLWGVYDKDHNRGNT